jgi:DNA (cytosine-5)-methyltransferase 1
MPGSSQGHCPASSATSAPSTDQHRLVGGLPDGSHRPGMTIQRACCVARLFADTVCAVGHWPYTRAVVTEGTTVTLTSVEICTGAGGQALGLEQAGFKHRAVVEIDPHACSTLRANRPEWGVVEANLHSWNPAGFEGVDLLAGGVPCPPFSKAGQQLGADDERDLFPRALELAEAITPKAVMLENVRGLLDPVFSDYRDGVDRRLRSLGYEPYWRLLQAADFGVPQLRPRVILVAIREGLREFDWPEPSEDVVAPTVGEALKDLMAADGWQGAEEWAHKANTIAPTLVGGSKKHGGPDLGPTRARQAWLALGVDGKTLAERAPEPGFNGLPRLTVRMAARIQGFPDHWEFVGRKTNAYRQVGNAFPPPVARAVGLQIRKAIRAPRKKSLRSVA